jgi:hypothetical protein
MHDHSTQPRTWKASTGYKLMSAKFPGRCVFRCGRDIQAGERIVYATQERQAMHSGCCPFLADLVA